MIKSLLFFYGFMLSCTAALCQCNSLSHAYWVIETHDRDTIYSVVRIFDGNNELLHEVTFENVVIDIARRRSRRKLDQLLARYKERAMTAAKKAGLRTVR